jgi:tetratricopeptide (TPR) repeat protein
MLFAACASVLCLFYLNCIRYEVDFLPALILLAVIGILGVERALAGRPRWRLAVRAGWGFLLAFSVAFNLLASLDRYAAQRCQLGNVFNASGRIPEAIAFYERALQIKPAYVEAHYNLGVVWSKVPGRLQDAAVQYEAVLRLKPDFAEAHHNLGVVWSQLPGRLQDAAGQYEAALRLKPDYAEAHYNLGNVWSQLPGRLQDAAGQYEAALRLKPDYFEAHHNLGLAWSQLPGRQRDAIAEYEAALRLKPDFAPGWHNLGVNWFRLGNLPAAAAAFREELRLSPNDPAAQQALATALQPGQEH